MCAEAPSTDTSYTRPSVTTSRPSSGSMTVDSAVQIARLRGVSSGMFAYSRNECGLLDAVAASRNLTPVDGAARDCCHTLSNAGRLAVLARAVLFDDMPGLPSAPASLAPILREVPLFAELDE